MNVGPYTYRRARFQHDVEIDDSTKELIEARRYWVRLFCVFDGERLYWFNNESDWLDNACLMRDVSPVTTFYQDVLVDSNQHKEIYDAIIDFENVFKSNSNKEC